MAENEKRQSWNSDNLGVQDEPRFIRHHPSELMLRALLSSRYTGEAVQTGPDVRVLDIGTMYTNNLIPFADRDCQCAGLEINDNMAELSRLTAEQQGIQADIRVGSNRSIPFEDGDFDLLLSLNVIHYEDNTDGLVAALKEYRRVLSEKGTAFIVSAGPEHYLRADADPLGSNQYRIQHEDFRKGQTMAYFDDLGQMETLCRTQFSQVTPGRLREYHAQADVDFFYVVARV